MDLHADLKRLTTRIDQGIDRRLPAETADPDRLSRAMRYSMQAGGKRLRPALVLAAARLFDPAERIDPLSAAIAVECVHTYSLIHDDLPCMDDDDLRRGRPTLHKAYDEATAVLAGDALLTFAFQILGEDYAAHPALAVALVRDLGDAAGHAQLVGGQILDLLHEGAGSRAGPDILNAIHAKKTAAMIRASLVMGGRVGGAPADALERLRSAGFSLGMAFQILDDILDATADRAVLGKTPGKDAEADKTTFVKIHGLERSREAARDYTKGAVEAFRSLPGDWSFLAALAESMAGRAN
ncbi:MAG: polyprenyl synthetase family protein [Opitutaceae bacterium]